MPSLFDDADLEPLTVKEPPPDPRQPKGTYHAIVWEWGRQRTKLGLPDDPDTPGLAHLKHRLRDYPLSEEEGMAGVRAYFSDHRRVTNSGCSLSALCGPTTFDKYFIQATHIKKPGQYLTQRSVFEDDEAFWGEE